MNGLLKLPLSNHKNHIGDLLSSFRNMIFSSYRKSKDTCDV